MPTNKILSDEFIKKYKNKNPKWGFNGLGYIVYKRCVTVDTPVLCSDMVWRPAGEIKQGDGVVGFDEYPLGKGAGNTRKIRFGNVMHNSIEDADVVQIVLEDGTTMYSTPDHPWLAHTGAKLEWVEAKDLVHENHLDKKAPIYYKLPRIFEVWDTPKISEFDRGYVSGVYDGEATVNRNSGIDFAQVNGPVLDKVKEMLTATGFAFTESKKARTKISKQDCYSLRIYGLNQICRFLGTFQPKRIYNKFLAQFDGINMAPKKKNWGGDGCYVRVKSVKPWGRQKIAVLSTDIKTHITNGFPSHNTYARPKQDGTTEEWYETVARCVEGAQAIGAQYTKEEAERLYDLVFNLKCNFAGRMLWQLGAPTVERYGGASLLNCFGGETEIITENGIRQIKDAVGSCRLMTEGGKYVDAEVKDFGKSDLYKICLTKGRSKKTVFATANHRWFRRPHRHGEERSKYGNIECITVELASGDKLVSTYGQSVKGIDSISDYGITHGVIFGDGSVCNNVGQVRLCGEKNMELLPYFADSCKVYNYEGDKIVSGLPKYYKSKPSLDMDKGYLYGWLAGYFAADGSVKEDGQIRLASASKENLDFVRDVCVKLGISYSPISVQMREGFGDEDSALYTICLNGSDLTEEFFLIKNHRDRFLNHGYQPRRDWEVNSVEKTDRHETVYCAVVPDTHSFVLESNILTGNCWFSSMNQIEDFCFVFENLMLGGGVGFSVQRADVHELPKVKIGVKASHQNTKDADFIVPDSREGWVSLLRKIMDSFFVSGQSFTYSTILVRGAGEKIAGFGGTASGPQILVDGMEKIVKVMQSREGKKLRSIDVLDINNIVGSIVVAGNVRRSAQIAIGDPDDHLYLRAKNWGDGNIPNWRAMSNNSIYADSYEQITRDVWETGYETDLETGMAKGEPYGFINIPLSQKFGRLVDGPMKDSKLYPTREDNCQGFNPCAEITLGDGEACNLCEIYLNNIENQEELSECAKLLYKTQKAVWTLPFHYEKTKNIVKKNMRIGLGVTGVCQSMHKLEWLDKTYKELRKFDKEWSKMRNWPESIKLTTVKPSGTLSLLAGSTPGGHPAYSEYYIRRIRMSSGDKLVPYCRDLGYHIEYVKNFDGTESRDTVVVEFPCASGKDAIISKNMTAIQQLDLVKKLQTVWADNAVSVTIYYRKPELPEIKKWMKENYESGVKSVSFLLHSDHGFQQAPYEEITEEKYKEVKKQVKNIATTGLDVSGENLQVECEGGACPVR